MSGFFQRMVRQPVIARPRNAFRLRPNVSPLEDRILQAIIAVRLTATPNILPKNGKYVPVHLVGGVFSTTPKDLPVVLFKVIDQYRVDEPAGRVKLRTTETPGAWAFDFTIYLQASRSNTFKDSRLYSVTVGASDAENGSGKTVPVIVPNPASTPKGPKMAARRLNGRVHR